MALKGVTHGLRSAGQAIPYPAGTLVKDSFILFVTSDTTVVRGAEWTDIASQPADVEHGYVGWSFHKIVTAAEIAAGIQFSGEAAGIDFQYSLFQFDYLDLDGVLRPAGSAYLNLSQSTATKPSSISVSGITNIPGGVDVTIYGFMAAQALATGTIGITTWAANIVSNRQSWLSPTNNGWIAGAGARVAIDSAGTAAGTMTFNMQLVAANFTCIGVRFNSGFEAGIPFTLINVSVGDPEYRKVKRLHIHQGKDWKPVKQAYIRKSGAWQKVYDLSAIKTIRVLSLGQYSYTGAQVQSRYLQGSLPTKLDPANRRYIVGFAAINSGQYTTNNPVFKNNTTNLTGFSIRPGASSNNLNMLVGWQEITSNLTKTFNLTFDQVITYACFIVGVYIETGPAGLILPPVYPATNLLTGGAAAKTFTLDWGANSRGNSIAVLMAAHTGGASFVDIAPDNVNEMARRNYASATYDMSALAVATRSDEVNEVRYPTVRYAAVSKGISVFVPLLFKLA